MKIPRRVQNRLLCITDEVPPNAFFATSAGTLSDGLCEQIRDFVKEHPDTVFVAVDTFQIVRNNNIDTSYANDYDEIRLLKQLADELNICLLLVHHLRKQGDSDPFNKLTGTTGISRRSQILLLFLTRASAMLTAPPSTAQVVTLKTVSSNCSFPKRISFGK